MLYRGYEMMRIKQKMERIGKNWSELKKQIPIKILVNFEYKGSRMCYII